MNEAFRIPRQNSSFTLSFEGIIGSSYYGDIAIDDVRAVAGECIETGQSMCIIFSSFFLFIVVTLLKSIYTLFK